MQGAPSFFGTGHQWFHNWDARLANAGTASDGGRLITIRHTNGYDSTFKESFPNSSWVPQNGNWRGQDRLFEKTTADGDDFDGFELRLSTGLTYRFVEYNFGSGTEYRLDEIVDSLQNVYELQYANNRWQLLKILAPGGEHSFTINWGWRFGLRVITKVTASDGRTVIYDYEELNAPEGGRYRALTQANYSDGTFGKYEYSWERFNFSRPVLSLSLIHI